MKKILFLVLIAAASVLLLSQGTSFAVTGQCSNCHTMHNSQNGSAMVTNLFSAGALSSTTMPQDYLLRGNCIGCHTNNNDGKDGRQNLSAFGAPAVLHIAAAPGGQGVGYTNAGGDFYWVSTLGEAAAYGDAYGHNVSGLADTDAALTAGPPGYDGAATSGFTYGQVAGGTWNNTTANPVTCDGTYGCHGRHAAGSDGKNGITGAHHTNTGLTATQATAPSTVGNSYRFLAGIKGLESSNWQYTVTSTDHNEYSGVDSPNNRDIGGAATYANKDTISYLCAECHGKFHEEIDDSATGASPWRRHPTDIALPADSTKEYTYYTTYSVEAPVGRPNLSAIADKSKVYPGTDIVVCVSCHRAHGSNQPDLLRWSYATMVAANGSANTGCFTCHTTKNDSL